MKWAAAASNGRYRFFDRWTSIVNELAGIQRVEIDVITPFFCDGKEKNNPGLLGFLGSPN